MSKTTYLECFPSPLLADLLHGRWLPIVGAGFSRNAVVPKRERMPLWEDLGKHVAADLLDYPYTGPVDALSAYEHEYSRPRLVERLGELLLNGRAAPGSAHEAFCGIPFDIVCTTNFDFLLEQQYERLGQPCYPIVDEEQLSVTELNSAVTVLKIHGDLRHPKRLVITEEDYDLFLDRHPLLATYLSSLLIQRTAVLVGYSLDDPDFRHLWQVIGERLGSHRRQAYAILVGAKPATVARFDRRGVKVINLPGESKDYGEVLAAALRELHGYLRENILSVSRVTEEEPLRELSLPHGAPTRLVFFAVPFAQQSFYREHVFPIAEKWGFVPLTADEVVEPGQNVMAKIEALIERASLVVVDVSTTWAATELAKALRIHDASRIIAVTTRAGVRLDVEGLATISRVGSPFERTAELVAQFDLFFSKFAEGVGQALSDEPERLFELGEYRAATISAITLLESELRRSEWFSSARGGRSVTLSRMLVQLGDVDGPFAGRAPEIREWMNIRNRAVHTDGKVTKTAARKVIRGVKALLDELRAQGAI